MRRTVLTACIALTSLLLVAGCAGSPAPATTSADAAASAASGSSAAPMPTNACDLLTGAEVTAAFGIQPDALTSGGGNQCSFTAPSLPNYVAVTLLNNVPKTFFATGSPSMGATQPVSGVGDGAFISPVGAQGGTMTVLSGTTILRIDVWLPVDAKVSAGLEQLATLILPRLK